MNVVSTVVKSSVIREHGWTILGRYANKCQSRVSKQEIEGHIYLLMILLVALSESANREGQELHKLLQESCSVLLLKEGHDLTLDYLLTLE